MKCFWINRDEKLGQCAVTKPEPTTNVTFETGAPRTRWLSFLKKFPAECLQKAFRKRVTFLHYQGKFAALSACNLSFAVALSLRTTKWKHHLFFKPSHNDHSCLQKKIHSNLPDSLSLNERWNLKRFRKASETGKWKASANLRARMLDENVSEVSMTTCFCFDNTWKDRKTDDCGRKTRL